MSVAVEAGEKLLLEIFYNGAPAFSVPEYAEVELRLTNGSAETLKDCSVWLGKEVVRGKLTLQPQASWSLPFKVDDLVGELGFKATAPGIESPVVTLQVVPRKLTLEDVLYIKTERLPSLLARLDAPNALQLHYQDPDDTPHLFDFFSADYTAEKLRHFSRAFLEEGAGEAILNGLDYLTPEQHISDLYTIRGPVRWPATLQNWFNRPAETGLRHEWSQSPKNFATLPNLLFVRFQLELAQELKRLVRYVGSGSVTSARLQVALAELKERASQHEALTESAYLPSKNVALDWDKSDSTLHNLLKQETERAANLNPVYARLYSLWKDFSSRYVSLPEDEAELARSGLQPMSKIYELWAACEVAAALGLTFETTRSLNLLTADNAVFSDSNGKLKLYYNKGLRGGWYSGNRSGLPRPDLRIESAGRQIFLDVKYRVGREDRARPDDVYKMLAYMHDFEVTTGGIIFPGQEPGAKALVVENGRGQRIVELALRPQIGPAEEQNQLENKLGEILKEL